MGENPVAWADVTVTPCPCSHQHFREVIAYGKVLKEEFEFGKLPYSRVQLVKWHTERIPRKIKPKEKHIPITQSRLSGFHDG